MEDHSGRTLRNLVNMIYSKQPLIKKPSDLKIILWKKIFPSEFECAD